MLKLGDWLGDCRNTGADGAVIDIGLTTVKVVTGTIPLPLFPPGLWFLTPLKLERDVSIVAGDVLTRSISIDVTSIRFLM